MSAVLEATIEKPPVISREIEEQDTSIRPYRFTVDELFAAVEAGGFAQPERLEIIGGGLPPKRGAENRPHTDSVKGGAKDFGAGFWSKVEGGTPGRVANSGD